MTLDKEMQAALEADGEKLRAMTGEDHGPGWIYEDELPEGYPYDEMFQHSKVDGVRMFPSVAASKKCPKCKAKSGDDWSQCLGYCPMPMSPHYIAHPQVWRIEIRNTDGTHHSFVPRFYGNIEPERALELLNMTLDHSRFVALVSWL